MIEENVDATLTPWLALARVRLDHVPPRSDVTLDAGKLKGDYRAVIERHPGTPAADEAMLYRASLLAQSTDAAELTAALDEVRAYIAGKSDLRYVSPLHGLRAAMFQSLKRYPEQLEASILQLQTREIDPSNPNQNFAWDYFSIGVLAQFDVGDFATARTYYNKLIAEYPNEQRVFLARKLMDDMDRIEQTLRNPERGARP
jgi:tetratricopeptide (TPR) repeat protein